MILQRIRENRLFCFVLAVIFAAGLAAILSHHHEGASQVHECPVCRLVSQFMIAFVGFVTLFFILGQPKRLHFQACEKFFSLLQSSSLANRAPPFLS
ncbi:MAG: hypothetical protein HYZ84_02950 [Candidatus Omnitrophica bacterium]|nr:hypothetical protein [Candidatus Omnitrophota bacterium]